MKSDGYTLDEAAELLGVIRVEWRSGWPMGGYLRSPQALSLATASNKSANAATHDRFLTVRGSG
jgi:hypothetical protein